MGRNSGTKGGWSSNGNGTKSKTTKSTPRDPERSGEPQTNVSTRKSGSTFHDHKHSAHDSARRRTTEGAKLKYAPTEKEIERSQKSGQKYAAERDYLDRISKEDTQHAEDAALNQYYRDGGV